MALRRARFTAKRLWRSWPAPCITIGAISISQLVLNEIAWSPGDPGTGAPSFLGDRHRRPRLAVPISASALPLRRLLRFPALLRTWWRSPFRGGRQMRDVRE